MKFVQFGVYHKKLEINAIQKYTQFALFDYVPVLKNGLTDSFDKKYEQVCQERQLQQMINEFNILVEKEGFQFLNSQLCMAYHQKMRLLEKDLLNGNDLNDAVNENIDAYENSMIKNIHSYCESHWFNKAVFMCGSAHRQSLIDKINNAQQESSISWYVYGD